MGAKLVKAAVAFLLIFVTVFTFSPADIEAASSKLVSKGNTNEKVVALTFDDGADGTNVNKILNTLETHKVKATFFLTGTGMNHHPQRIKNITAKGHQIGNHSYTHKDFTKLTAAQIKSELNKTEALAKSITGKTTKPIFRAPFGYTNAAVLSAVGNAGYTHTLHWNIDTIDWRGLSKTEVTNKVVNNIVPGSIVLMHTGAGAPGTPAALPDIIKKLKAKGYKFVTVSEMLKLQPSQSSGKTYTVKAGDTLSSIAAKNKTTVAKLAALNNIKNVNVLKVGQKLKLSGTAAAPSAPSAGTTYTVKAGDTLYSIAAKYKTTVSRLVSVNKLSNPNKISVGQKLKMS
ncbi:LysM peptidoglycan-binding domain-containing protein [Alkalicoccus halolimnae]|uniref:LysM peptidoglycan-binding domain-containing protein n=1 Tax=Alkalicoccus halolimnae TaxID=1667239 RepID=A0A5C7F332_9BACI|nr:LysM peptidoglycan-binding domain-containing protein [Alkalicoccus halolimnae]TXF81679.1 polysaccharide deacetylase family protein [Alkalicoccus halolimnae]